ncbi:MAG TPA: hypothetical protein VF546_22640 [Pyrinomonadaceae bacterium]|jgi:hypothetical protein
MLRPASLIIGALCCLLGVAGFVYNSTRPRPPLVALAPEELPTATPQPDAAPAATPAPTPDAAATPPARDTSALNSSPSNSTPLNARPQTPAPVFAPPPDVRLVAPAMVATYTAPAAVALKAEARPAAGLSLLEFYYEPTGAYSGASRCRSLSKLDVPRPLTLIGGLNGPPYELTWRPQEPGAYSLTAVATYETGVRQMSPPVVVVVNPADDYAGVEWRGWRPPYRAEIRPGQDLALLPSPTPTPTLALCPAVTVSSPNVTAPVGATVTFNARVAGDTTPPGLTYDWRVSGGVIVGGQGTPTINVATAAALEKSVTASVEIGRLDAVCPATAAHAVRLALPRWLNAEARALLRGVKLKEYVAEFKAEDGAQLYIVARAQGAECPDEETLARASLARKYMVKLEGVEAGRIVLMNGGRVLQAGDPLLEFWIVPPGAEPPYAGRTARPLPLAACAQPVAAVAPARHVPKVSLNRKCPDVSEPIAYATDITEPDVHAAINICPYNPADPQNDMTQLPLNARVATGSYGSIPAFDFWTNGGRVVGVGAERIWDLSAVKLRPGIYTVVAHADDGCDCASVNTRQVRVTNFCTPCLTLKRVCEPDASEGGRQTFAADVSSFAAAPAQSYHWQTTHGTISAGQGTPEATVDTSTVPAGTEFLVTVSVGGLQRYCANKLTYQAVAGQPCPPHEIQILPKLFSDAPPPRRARRESPPAQPAPPPQVARPVAATTGVEPDTNAQKSDEPRPPAEKEWIEVKWSPRVEVQRSFSVVVRYNRATERVEAVDKSGTLVAPLQVRGSLKLLKEKYGPDYEVRADVRLRSSGFECDGCEREQYQSLDAEQVEWSWNVTPKRSGTQTFNLELWVKGVPRESGAARAAKEAEKVWSRNSLEVQVREPLLTRNTIFASSLLFTFAGVGFSVRGLRIYRVGDTYNVGQAVAVGRNVQMTNTTVNQQGGPAAAPEQPQKEKE